LLHGGNVLYENDTNQHDAEETEFGVVHTRGKQWRQEVFGKKKHHQ
jgi:hypothetical protein